MDYYVEEFAHRCIDAGADAVIGTGNHLLKGIEIYKGKPIFYCLGNFLFHPEYVKRLSADVMDSLGFPQELTGEEAVRRRKARATSSMESNPIFYLSMVPDNVMYIPFTSVSALVLLLFWGVLTHLLPMLFDMERTDWDTKEVFLKETPMRDLGREAAYKALESMKGTIIAMVFSIIFLGGQLMMFPITLPFTVTIGFCFPAMAGALSHTEPDV